MSAFTPSSEPTTEWDDAQRRLGNLPPLPPMEIVATPEQMEALVVERAEKQLRTTMQRAFDGDTKDSDEDDLLAELLDDEASEAAFAAYRKQRMSEFRSHSSAEHHGRLREISRSEFQGQVTDHKGDVVLLLADNNVEDSKLLEQRFKLIAEKFTRVKFLRIQATECIPNYPERNVPTVLVYRQGELLKNFVGLVCFGGKRGNVDDLEWELAQLKVLETELETKPSISQQDRIVVNIRNKVPTSDASPVA